MGNSSRGIAQTWFDAIAAGDASRSGFFENARPACGVRVLCMKVLRLFFALSVAALVAAGLASASGQAGVGTAAGGPAAQPQLAILDTDIGDDIDDAFALGLVLRSPELKLLGITTAFGDTELRERLVDRYLFAIRENGIPVAAGVPTKANNVFTQRTYAEQSGHMANPCRAELALVSQVVVPKSEKEKYDACEKRRRDGVGFLLDQIRAHPGQITLIGIGPLFNVQAAIEKDPATFKKLKRVVIMGGSIDRGYDSAAGNNNPPDAEWNIKCDPAGLKALLASGVPVYIMPLDSTQVRLSQHDLEEILAHGSPITDQLALLYHQWVWGNGVQWTNPTLFDPVAVAYSIRPDLCPTTPMRIEVDDKGFTRRVDGTPNAEVCMKSDEKGFLTLLKERLTEKTGQ